MNFILSDIAFFLIEGINNRQYFTPQNRQMNSWFHSGAEELNRTLSALQSEPCKCELAWSMFSWVRLVFSKLQCRIHCPRIAPWKTAYCYTISQGKLRISQGKLRIVTPLPATCAVFKHPLTMHFLS